MNIQIKLCFILQNLSPENYRDNVQASLDILHASIPRALVNLVTYFDVSPLTNISDGLVCDAIHPGLCPCATDEEFVWELKGVQMEFTRLLEELVASGRYDTRDDFTVVFQPHLRDVTPVLDVSDVTSN